MKKKLMIIFILILCTILTTSSFAYTLMIHGYEREDICMNTAYYVDSAYSTAVSNAISNWNNVADFWIDGSCTGGSAPYENIVYTTSVNESWYGRYTPSIDSSPPDPDHTAESFKIYLNKYHLGSEGTSFKQSTMAHEIGHAYGLNHSSATALMNIYRDRDTVYTVKTDDANGVNASW